MSASVESVITSWRWPGVSASKKRTIASAQPGRFSAATWREYARLVHRLRFLWGSALVSKDELVGLEPVLQTLVEERAESRKFFSRLWTQLADVRSGQDNGVLADDVDSVGRPASGNSPAGSPRAG